jgi:hypothetical protein
MTLASAELQRAVFERLTQAGLRVFDGVPVGSPLPYVSFGRASAVDWSTSTEKGEEHLFSLHVWARGRKAAQEMAGSVKAALDGVGPVLGACRLADLRFVQAEFRDADGLGLREGILRFRALIEIA